MKSIKKGLSLALTAGLAIVPMTEAKLSLSSFTEKTQKALKDAKASTKKAFNDFTNSLSNAHNKTQQMWHDLSPETQAALLGGLAAVGAAAVAAGTGIAISQSSGSKQTESPNFEQVWSKMSEKEQKETLALIGQMTAGSH